MRILLCAGHGWALRAGTQVRDPGAIAPNGLTEHALCRSIARKVMALVQDVKGINLHVLLGNTLEEKIAVGEALRPDLAVDVHLNAFPDPIVMGTEVLYRKLDPPSAVAAVRFRNSLVDVLGSRDRGVKPSEKYFLRAAKWPAIITEANFLSNPVIADQLAQGWLLSMIAYAHAEAIWMLLPEYE